MRSVLVTILVLTLMSAVCLVAPASAAQPHDRTGFFIGFGAGAGTAGWENGGDRSGGFVGNFRIGYAVAPNVTRLLALHSILETMAYISKAV
jgi:hypothetical protein